MDEVRQKDPMGILLNQPGALAPMPYIVTVQLQFRVDSDSEQKATLAVMHGISLRLPLSTSLVSQGIQAQAMTKEVMAELAELAKTQGIKV